MILTGLLPERCGESPVTRIKVLPPDVDIQTDPHDQRRSAAVRDRLCQDTADLPFPNQNIIRPFDRHAVGTHRGDCIRNRHSRKKRDLCETRRGECGTENYGEMEIAARRRLPGSPQPAPSGDLPVGKNHGSLGSPFPSKLRCRTVRRVHLRKAVKRKPDLFPGHPRPEGIYIELHLNRRDFSVTPLSAFRRSSLNRYSGNIGLMRFRD